MDIYLEKRLDAVEQAQKELWMEIKALRENHNSHDLVIQRLAMSIEQMGKELTRSVTALSSSLENHLNEEQQSMKNTVAELRRMGWKVFYGIIVVGIVGVTGMKWVV